MELTKEEIVDLHVLLVNLMDKTWCKGHKGWLSHLQKKNTKKVQDMKIKTKRWAPTSQKVKSCV